MKRITEGQQDFFFDLDRATDYLEEVRKSPRTRYMDFLSLVKKLDIKGRYLDVGCGPGLLTSTVARIHPSAMIAGIDNSEEMIELARIELDNNLKERVEYFIADACDADSLKNLGKFDLIFSTYTMHHWEDAPQAIKNLCEILNDGGTLCIFDLKRVWWLYYFPSQSGFFKSVRASYRPSELRKIMDNMGVSVYTINTHIPFFLISLVINK